MIYVWHGTCKKVPLLLESVGTVRLDIFLGSHFTEEKLFSVQADGACLLSLAWHENPLHITLC